MIPNGFVQPFLVFRVCFRVFSWPIFSWIFVCFRSFFVAFRGCLLFSRNFRVFSCFFSWVFRGCFRGFFVDFRGFFVVFRGFPLFSVLFFVFFKVRIFTRFHGQSTVFHGQMHTFSRANFSQGGTHGVIQPQNSQNNTLLSEWLSHFSYL